MVTFKCWDDSHDCNTAIEGYTVLIVQKEQTEKEMESLYMWKTHIPAQPMALQINVNYKWRRYGLQLEINKQIV